MTAGGQTYRALSRRILLCQATGSGFFLPFQMPSMARHALRSRRTSFFTPRSRIGLFEIVVFMTKVYHRKTTSKNSFHRNIKNPRTNLMRGKDKGQSYQVQGRKQQCPKL